MITGYLNTKLEAVIALEVFGADGQPHTIEAVIDTGYSSFLTLPASVVSALGLNSIGNEQLTLADGSEIVSAICQATIIWDGQLSDIAVDTLETMPLIGMAMMSGYDLSARIVVGGRVTLTAYTPSSS